MTLKTNFAAETCRLPFEALQNLLKRIFLAAGASEHVANILSANCAGCERDGALSHGIFRIPGYVSSIRSGWVDPAAVPVLETGGSGFLRVDARNGFTQVALDFAAQSLKERARQEGVALLSIRNSHHFSALWPDVVPFAEEGLLAVAMVNSFACTAPFDAKVPVFGTNPVAFAAPCDGMAPMVVDMATSAIANGDVQIAAREGFSLPPGLGIDRSGEPTVNPHAVLDGGALLTFGGYKGSAISMLVEVMSAALTGGKFSYEVDWSDYPGAQTPHTGQLVILIDPDIGRNAQFSHRVRHLVERLRLAKVSRLPGDRRLVTRERSMREGVCLQKSDLERMELLAQQRWAST
ncbi:Ldh family oxidoreductase [Agrobacterium vitis]|uniref:Ldh family oxidoreductase n=1 Tax=Allorhizobium ampelinum TaxID=3025782 RepID=UPI001F2C7DFF|nr:Ldh family oxidoreductase [Allorhizobium ampelinum]MCF1464824.1 Ldh family oxidoreductase [Allorhizobium ampelinum]